MDGKAALAGPLQHLDLDRKGLKLLHVEFKGGDVYAYKNVPVDVGFEFMNAQSAGRHFHANIRHNYAGKKITPDDLLAAG